MTLVSSVDLKKADGSPLKVNFQFENGLPVMPIIENPYKFGFDKEYNIPVFVMTLTKDDTFKDEKILRLLYEKKNNDLILWISFESFYLCFNNVSDTFSKFYIAILDDNGNCVKKGLINAN